MGERRFRMIFGTEREREIEAELGLAGPLNSFYGEERGGGRMEEHVCEE